MENLAPIQVGPVEDDTHEIIRLIQSYYLSADFANWISEERFTQKILKEHRENGKYTRIFQYDLEGVIFFSGTKEFHLDKMDKEVIDVVLKKQPLVHSSDAFFSKMEKVNLAKVIAEPYYNVISHLYNKGEIIGVSWETYDLPRLVHIYRHKDDPIRYWRKDRRE